MERTDTDLLRDIDSRLRSLEQAMYGPPESRNGIVGDLKTIKRVTVTFVTGLFITIASAVVVAALSGNVP